SRGSVLVNFSESAENVASTSGWVTSSVLRAQLLGAQATRVQLAEDQGLLQATAVADLANTLLRSSAYERRINRDLRIVTAALPPTVVGEPYQAVVAVSGAAAIQDWLAIGLPTGITMDP